MAGSKVQTTTWKVLFFFLIHFNSVSSCYNRSLFSYFNWVHINICKFVRDTDMIWSVTTYVIWWLDRLTSLGTIWNRVFSTTCSSFRYLLHTSFYCKNTAFVRKLPSHTYAYYHHHKTSSFICRGGSSSVNLLVLVRISGALPPTGWNCESGISRS